MLKRMVATIAAGIAALGASSGFASVRTSIDKMAAPARNLGVPPRLRSRGHVEGSHVAVRRKPKRTVAQDARAARKRRNKLAARRLARRSR